MDKESLFLQFMQTYSQYCLEMFNRYMESLDSDDYVGDFDDEFSGNFDKE